MNLITTLYPKIRASIRWVADLLLEGGTYRLYRNGREALKLVSLHGAALSQLVLVSQFTVATILGLHRKIQCATRLGVLDVPRSSAHKAKEFLIFRTLIKHLLVLGKIA